MDNRFLSRGKRLDNREWVQGYYCIATTNEHGCKAHHAIQYEREPNWWVREIVDPATVGQCTGLPDNNGTLIFEGDILQWQRADIMNPEILHGIVMWRFDQWHVVYDIECDRFWVLSAVVDRGTEVIGNKWDGGRIDA